MVNDDFDVNAAFVYYKEHDEKAEQTPPSSPQRDDEQLGNDFEKAIDKGGMPSVSRSIDGKSFYKVCARFGEDDERKSGNFQLLKSKDMGKTWTDLYLFEDKLLDRILFYNDLIGFASVIQEPVGYDIPVLYKTSDGGKTWKPTKVDMDNKSVDLITPEGKLVGQYVEDEPAAIWEMDINDMVVKRIPYGAF